MARCGRYVLADQPLHVIQRGNNREAIFFGEQDYVRYRDWLAAAAAEYGCAIYGYVLMTNHVHVLVTPSRACRAPCSRSAAAMCATSTRIYRRTGTLWGRALSRRANRWRSV
jgi:putative transposase